MLGVNIDREKDRLSRDTGERMMEAWEKERWRSRLRRLRANLLRITWTGEHLK